MSNLHEIKYMLSSLKIMQDKLGGPNTKRSLAGTQFDFIQQQFLRKRYEIQKLQNQKQKQGLTTKTADIPYKIRQGIKQLKSLFNKLQQQYQRLSKKKKDTPQILQRKKKIVQNCQKLYKGIQERQNDQITPNNYKKPQTFTQMKAKLLSQIDIANINIHSKQSSEQQLDELGQQQQMKQMEAYKNKDQQIDIVLDDVIENVVNVRKKVRTMNQKQDQIKQKVQIGNKKAAQLGKRIKNDNQKLKVIIQQFKPGRCCLAVFLLLLFIGLIVVIIKFLVPN